MPLGAASAATSIILALRGRGGVGYGDHDEDVSVSHLQRPKYSVLLRMRSRASAAAILVAGTLFGCAHVPEEQGPVFYPPLPNPPRIQYLTTFSKPEDLAGTGSRFARFVLGDRSTEPALVRKPYGVAIHGGKLYVVDTRGPGYAVFDLTRNKFKLVPGAGGGKMKKPINITIDDDENKYVTDTEREQILVFDKNDQYVSAYGAAGQFKPGDVAIVADRLYVTDMKHHRIEVLDKHTGETLFDFAEAGSKTGELYYPTNLAVSEDQHLYITDTGNFRVEKYTLDGQYVRSYGEIGTGFGSFARPKGVSLDRNGFMYVVDAAFENVQIFDSEGNLLLFFGGPGENPENINMPTDVVIDYNHSHLFQRYAAPKFKLEYLILVASQFGDSKVNVYGFGKMEDLDYSVGSETELNQR
ncbi:MAG: hypothetical protein OES26_27175 [Gammaproteobacteria bacterium]|nr:hypothetical protein [Gammaproteobacteria bacterium]